MASGEDPGRAPRAFGGAAGDAGRARGRQVAANIGVQMAQRVLTMALSTLTVAVLARELAPSGFGVWNGALAYVGLVSVLAELGLVSAGVQRMSAEPEREAEWLGAMASLRGLFSLGAAALCAAGVPLVFAEGQERTVAWVLTLTVLTGIGQSLLAVFQTRLRAGILAGIAVGQGVAWTGAVLVLSARGAGVETYAIVYVAVSAAVALVQWRATQRWAHIAWRAGRGSWRPLLRVAFPLGLSGLLIMVYYQVDSILLLRLSDAHEAGVYGAAYRVLTPLLALPALIVAPFFPVLAAVYGSDRARARRLVQQCADLMAAVSLPCLAGSLVLSGPAVGLLFGDDYDRSAQILPILMASFVVICFGSLGGLLAPVLDLQWRLAAYSALAAGLNVVGNLLLIPAYGAMGSAWATLATELVATVLLLGTGLRRLGLRLAPQRLLRTAAAAAIAGGAMLAARPLGLGAAIVAGGAAYAAACFALRVVSIDELRRLRAVPS
jgi:PST family polysaccharide transporter